MDERAKTMRIDVAENGPYLVSGNVPLIKAEIATNELGESVSWRQTEQIESGEVAMLCRCGGSNSKPFCDGTHAGIGFDGTETAEHDLYLALSACIEGPGVKLHDARSLCAEARFCDRAGGLWNLVRRVDDPDTKALVAEEAGLCPSGRYVLCDADGDTPVEPDYEASIVLVEDPHIGCSGPLWVRGGIPVFGADGVPYEVRNRVTLCRCGQSGNKPYCDGSHVAAGFRAQY